MASIADSDEHRRLIDRAFTEQAAAFENRATNRPFVADAAWMMDRLPCTARDLVLDVAAGTGHAARRVAPRARAVVAIDATSEMLRRGQAAARREGLDNIVFQAGDASALPFPDGSFDAAVCRFAVHHFEQPAVQVGELVRCVRPGGHVLIADLIADSEAAVAARQNELERLRDPSHTRMLSADELAQLLRDAGTGDVDVQTRRAERPLEPWLEQTRALAPDGGRVRAALQAELAGGPASGLAPRLLDGTLMFTQTFAACLGAVPR